MALLDRSSQALLNGSTSRTRDLPRAAVEIIARLSAERGRLRDEVARLRSELRQAPQPETLARLRAERDALARQLADAHQQLSKQNTSGAFQRLQGRQVEALGKLAERLESAVCGFETRMRTLDRLERAVSRLEQSGQHAAPAAAPAAAQGPSRTTRAMPRSGGGGMLAGLVQANVELRGGASAASARTRAEPAPQPAARVAQVAQVAPPEPAPAPRPRGGGLLGNLINQNLGYRRRGTTNH